MKFSSPLIHGTLIKRYKRFLADITLQNGDQITAHCPNTGSMLSCSTPGSPVCLSLSDNPKRKYPHTLEMILVNNTWIGVNTSRTNKLVVEAIEKNQIPEFTNVDRIKTEVKISDKTRLDLQLFEGDVTTYVEIKNCSLAEGGVAMFPDAVTTRGNKHLNELSILAQREGTRACIFYLIQRSDAESFAPAAHIDPTYAKTLGDAQKAGVEVLAYQAKVSPEGIDVVRPLPCSL